MIAFGILLLAATGAYISWLGGTRPSDAPDVGGPFLLQASDGRTVTDKTFLGRWTLIYFGYTACRDVCPATLATVRDALDRLGPRGNAIQPLFITVDPTHDTPAQLHAYLDAVSPRFLGLSGNAHQIATVEHAYHVEVSATTPATIDHSSVLYLNRPDGRTVGLIPSDDSSAAMVKDIERYLR